MENKPLVSLCLLCYNQESFIGEAIEGALNQTYTPLEIIISDDASSDNTFSIIEQIAKDYTGPHTIRINRNPKNLGLAAHVNLLTHNLAQGELIALAAGDDVSLPNRISFSVEFLIQHPEVVALSTAIIYIDDRSNELQDLNSHLTKTQIFDINDYLKNPDFHINGPSRIFRRVVAQTFGPLHPLCPTEDSTYLLRSFILGKVALLHTPFVRYRWHNNNMSAPQNIHSLSVKKIRDQYLRDITLAETLSLIDKKEKNGIIKYIHKKIKKRKRRKQEDRLIKVKMYINVLLTKIVNIWYYRK